VDPGGNHSKRGYYYHDFSQFCHSQRTDYRHLYFRIYYFSKWFLSGSSTDDVNVTIYSTTSAANAGPDQATLQRNVHQPGRKQPGIFRWNLDQSNQGPAGEVFSPNANTPQCYLYRGKRRDIHFAWSISNTSCSSVDEVRIDNSAPPSTAAAGPDQVQVCGPGKPMAANLPPCRFRHLVSSIKAGPGAPDPSITSVISQTRISQYGSSRIPGNLCVR